jgi:hypothetical protein
MSIVQLKTEAAALTDAERRELIGYLVNLGKQRAADYYDRLAAKVEDDEPAHWVGEENLDQALGLNRPEE